MDFKERFSNFRDSGSPGKKEQLLYLSLNRQMENGKERGYSEKELADVLTKCIALGLPLKDYLEAMRGMVLEMLMQIIRAHFQENTASELYASLTNLAQLTAYDPQNFLLRALKLLEKFSYINCLHRLCRM